MVACWKQFFSPAHTFSEETKISAHHCFTPSPAAFPTTLTASFFAVGPARLLVGKYVGGSLKEERRCGQMAQKRPKTQQLLLAKRCWEESVCWLSCHLQELWFVLGVWILGPGNTGDLFIATFVASFLSRCHRHLPSASGFSSKVQLSHIISDRATFWTNSGGIMWRWRGKCSSPKWHGICGVDGNYHGYADVEKTSYLGYLGELSYGQYHKVILERVPQPSYH